MHRIHIQILLAAAFGTRRRPQRSRGASLVEYALLVALIAIACFVAVQFFGSSASTSFSRTGASVAGV